MKAKPNIQRSFIEGFMKEVPENEFLTNINKIVDFEGFRSTLDNCYENFGRCAYDPVILLKLLLLERFYNLSDRAVVDEATDRISFRLFLGIDFTEKLPDDTTLVYFRNRLEENDIYNKLMARLETQIEKHGFHIKEGRITIVDATLVKAHTRPKSGNPEHLERLDPGAQITARNKGPICGYKMHIAMDAETRIIRQVKVTGAKKMEVHHLIIPQGTKELMADKGYHSAENRRKLKEHGIRDRIMYRGARAHPLTEDKIEHNRPISRARSAIESKFGEMKRWHGLERAIYRGIERVKRQIIMTVLAVNMKRLAAICAQSTG
jgi:IS5 family transposase